LSDLDEELKGIELEKSSIELSKLKIECELKMIELNRSKSTFSSIVTNPLYLGTAVTLWVGIVTAAITYINGHYSLKLEETKLRNDISIERDKIGSSYYQNVLTGKDLGEISAKRRLSGKV
jgi:hypothetical protein